MCGETSCSIFKWTTGARYEGRKGRNEEASEEPGRHDQEDVRKDQ